MSKLSPDQWQALSPRLDEALEMTDDERSSWLSSLQSENPTLAYQLEILLREHRELSEEGFLEASAMELPGGHGLVLRPEQARCQNARPVVPRRIAGRGTSTRQPYCSS